MNSNASARDVKWWMNLGNIVAGEHDYVKFSIDGLADTNHLYRRNTNFAKIIENAKSFIDAGGKAHWDFIVFRHNEHQIEEARQLAQAMGFARFAVKKTGRFFSNTRMEGKEAQEVQNRQGEVEYWLEKPLAASWQNTALAQENDIIARHGSMEAYLDRTPIDCKTAAEASVYISAEGLVFPCCWTANQLYVWYLPERSAPIWSLLDSVGGKKAIDARVMPLDEIVNGPFFRLVEASWSKPSCREGKLKVCAKTCGTEFDPFRAQF
jgi:sulfatase maturation enzyme AslB (radical SAM superfamily)